MGHECFMALGCCCVSFLSFASWEHKLVEAQVRDPGLGAAVWVSGHLMMNSAMLSALYIVIPPFSQFPSPSGAWNVCTRLGWGVALGCVHLTGACGICGYGEDTQV